MDAVTLWLVLGLCLVTTFVCLALFGRGLWRCVTNGVEAIQFRIAEHVLHLEKHIDENVVEALDAIQEKAAMPLIINLILMADDHQDRRTKELLVEA
jgi:hypothetical protein